MSTPFKGINNRALPSTYASQKAEVIELEPNGQFYAPKYSSRTNRDWLARGVAFLALIPALIFAVERILPSRDATPSTEPPSVTIPVVSPSGTDGIITVTFTPVDPLWSASQPIVTADLTLQLYITSKDMAFDFAAIDKLNVAGQTVDLAAEVITPVFINSFANCKALVVIGTSSQEGAPAEEDQRALDRSNYAQYQIWSTGKVACPVFTLNLGQARKTVETTNNEKTAHQRRLIVATVLNAAPNTVGTAHLFRAALRRALGQVKGLPVDVLRDFSRFDLTQQH